MSALEQSRPPESLGTAAREGGDSAPIAPPVAAAPDARSATSSPAAAPTPDEATPGYLPGALPALFSGIRIAKGWENTAKAMQDFTLIRSMTNKEGNHQRATYQLHTGYVPSATIKHPHIGCSMVSELGERHFDLPHIVSIGGPTIGAGWRTDSFDLS